MDADQDGSGSLDVTDYTNWKELTHPMPSIHPYAHLSPHFVRKPSALSGLCIIQSQLQPSSKSLAIHLQKPSGVGLWPRVFKVAEILSCWEIS